MCWLSPTVTHLAERLMLRAVVAATTLLATMAAAGPMRADSNDDLFLNALNSRGIAYASPDAAIAAGHEVCRELDAGSTGTQVAIDVKAQSSFDNYLGSLDDYHAGFFVGVSIAAYCPYHHGAT